MTVEELTVFMRSNGYIRDGNFTPEGREWLREQGVHIPDDKSLIDLGLEHLVEFEMVEEMERMSGRKASNTPQ